MVVILSILVVLILALIIVHKAKRTRDRKEVEDYSIAPEELYSLMLSGKAFLLYDLRRPLDLLAHPMVIPGSLRIAPADLKKNPGLIPRDRDVIVYCTCPTDKTAHLVIRSALSMHYTRARLLRGGLDAWRSQGYETTPFTTPFHLETADSLA